MAERALAFRQAQEEALGHDQNGALGEEDGGRGVAGMAKKMQGLRSGMKGGGDIEIGRASEVQSADGLTSFSMHLYTDVVEVLANAFHFG